MGFHHLQIEVKSFLNLDAHLWDCCRASGAEPEKNLLQLGKGGMDDPSWWFLVAPLGKEPSPEAVVVADRARCCDSDAPIQSLEFK